MRQSLATVTCIVSGALWMSTMSSAPEIGPGDDPSRQPTTRRLHELPLYFVENQGQADPRVGYYVQGRTTSVQFARDAVYYSLHPTPARKPGALELRQAGFSPEQTVVSGWTVKLELLNASPAMNLRARNRTGAVVSYFRGPEEHWRTGLPTYTSIVYEEVWPGIDLEFTGPAGNLKYTFHLKPGADPRQIRFAYRGASSVTLTPQGSLAVETLAGGFFDDRPVAWQETAAGRRHVPVTFALEQEEVGFQVGEYDRSQPLVLDPVVLLYAGYIGGAQNDYATGIAVDGSGNAYVVGYAFSTQTTFPVTVGPDTTHNGLIDVVVAKVNASGTGLVYAGYLGGDGFDYGFGIAVDAAGSAYVVGETSSTEASFPVAVGPDLSFNGGIIDGFVAKVNASGTGLVYAGYIGGNNSDRGYGIAVDGTGNAYIAGETASSQPTFPATVGPDLTYNGGAGDAFVAKVNPGGTGFVYAGYVGGNGVDYARSIAVDGAGNAYLVGGAVSTQTTFPVTAGPDLTHNGGIWDVLVAKVNPGGTGLVYAGYIGGSAADHGRGVAVDGAGSAYVVGYTESTQATFPVTVGPDLTQNGGEDAFVAKVTPSGTGLVYAGYLGSSNADRGYGIAVDLAGNAYVTGYTEWAESAYPVAEGPDLSQNGAQDAFVTKVNAAGTGLVYSGYVGGSGEDQGFGIAVDTAGNAYIAGHTTSNQSSFPVTVGPDLNINGYLNAFAAKIEAFPGTSGPVLAFRNGFNAIETNTFPAPALRNSGGSFRLDPELAMSAAGRAFLAARDSSAGVWINFLKPDNSYNGWVFAGGNSPGQPALAVAGETAWIAVRDPWNSYSVRSYTPGAGFSSWTWLQGILATTPQIAACPNNDVYITGKDNWNGMWTRRYSANLASWQSWRFIGGIVTGAPSIACGSDNAAYIAVRDSGNNAWMARVEAETSTNWHYAAGLWDGDLKIAANGNLIYISGLSSSAPWFRTWQVGSTWQGAWMSPGGILAHVAPAIYAGNLYLTGQDGAGNLWWWNSLGNSWSNFGNRNVAPGSRFAAGGQ